MSAAKRPATPSFFDPDFDERRERGVYHLPAGGFEDEADAPPVDARRLQQLERGELGEAERAEVLRLVQTYHSWFTEALRQERAAEPAWHPSSERKQGLGTDG